LKGKKQKNKRRQKKKEKDEVRWGREKEKRHQGGGPSRPRHGWGNPPMVRQIGFEKKKKKRAAKVKKGKGRGAKRRRKRGKNHHRLLGGVTEGASAKLVGVQVTGETDAQPFSTKRRNLWGKKKRPLLKKERTLLRGKLKDREHTQSDKTKLGQLTGVDIRAAKYQGSPR